MKKRIFNILFYTFVVLAVIYLILFLLSLSKDRGHPPAAAVKIAGVSSIQVTLEQYAKNHDGLYPPFSSLVCSSVLALEPHLSKENFEILKTQVGDGDFYIGVAEDRRNYVIKTEFSDENSLAIPNSDQDEMIFGCDCDDPSYCRKGP